MKLESRPFARGDEMRRLFLNLSLLAVLLASCQAVDLNAPIPTFETGIDPKRMGASPCW
jgi:hypothetical protein